MSDRAQISPGERFHDIDAWDERKAQAPHLWVTLGYRRLSWEPGATEIAWTATEDYCFPTAGGPIVQGGLVTALLDAAMGGGCWTVLDMDQAFLTADLRVEFLRSARPGELVGRGWVVRRTRRVVFCAGEVRDDSGTVLATSRCTQVLLPADGRAGRYQPFDAAGAPPDDARG
jgi:uncharacterized protein (TIGR00369 family)